MTELIVLFIFLSIGCLRYRLKIPSAKSVFIFFEVAAIFFLGFKDKIAIFIGFLTFLGVFYFLLRKYIFRPTDHLYKILLLLPVCGIVFLKSQSFIVVAGFSYLAFRLCYMVAESKSKLIKTITPQDFLDFVFFLPVFSMGPIIRYREFQQQPQLTPSMLDGGFRIIWGILKFKVICLIFKPLTFEVLFFDGYKHGWVDFLLSGFSYLLYLYFNFSGFMDVAIGAGAFVGIKLPENFSSPFASRNMKELWNRWHITLNHFMRDLLFLPFLKFLLKKGSIKQDGSIAISLLFTFILTGLWHGFTMSYFLYGAFHGIGLGIHHFYSKFITKIMGAKLELYLSNPWIKLIATGMTIIYFSISMFFFENSLSQMKDILSNIGSRL